MDFESVRDTHATLREKYSRAERGRLAPSRIGTQFFCEQKVALLAEHGDIDTPEKQEGTTTHEAAAADAIEVSEDELWDAIESGERTVTIESSFVADAAEFLLGGIPDAVVFEKQQPRLVFDRKTTAHPDRVYDNQRIQVWLYGFMLDQIGFDTDSLRIVILSHDRGLDEGHATQVQDRVLREADQWDNGTHELSEGAVVHLFDYSPIDFLNELHWALGYWRDERAPEPTTNAAKCRSCEYESVCPYSLA